MVHERLMTAKEVSQWLNINERVIMNMQRKNQFPSKKIGHAVRFSPTEIKKWLALKD